MLQFSPSLAFLGQIGWMEITILAVLGVLVFGRRLPEVGRNIGRGIVEFKKGLQGITDEMDSAGQSSNASGSQSGQLNEGQARQSTDATASNVGSGSEPQPNAKA